MKSGWIINDKEGLSVILTESAYQRYSTESRVEEDIQSEEHWFSIEDAKRKNPNLTVIE